MKRSDIPTIEVLIACHQFHKEKNGITPWQALMDKFSAPEKVVYAAMDRDCDKGLLDYGTTLRTAWVTEEGYELLEEKKL